MEFEEDDPFEEQKEKADNPMRRLFLEYGAENKVPFAAGVFGSLAARVLDILPPLLLGLALDSIFPARGTEPRPFRLPLVPQSVIPNTQEGQFWFAVGLILFAFFGGAVFHWARNWGWNAFSQNIQHAIRTDTYDKMQRLNMEFFATKQTGEMMSVLSNDVNRLERFLNGGLNSLFRLGVMVLGIGGIMLWMNWQLAIVALLPVPLIAGFTYKFIEIIQPKYQSVRQSVGKMNSRLENNLGGIQVIKTSTTEDY
ncbi:MAG: ABC transporter transmembrane domain-containing protein, partial [Halobacteriaceae archaeon]